jgi:hypothetical protein
MFLRAHSEFYQKAHFDHNIYLVNAKHKLGKAPPAHPKRKPTMLQWATIFEASGEGEGALDGGGVKVTCRIFFWWC